MRSSGQTDESTQTARRGDAGARVEPRRCADRATTLVRSLRRSHQTRAAAAVAGGGDEAAAGPENRPGIGEKRAALWHAARGVLPRVLPRRRLSRDEPAKASVGTVRA